MKTHQYFISYEYDFCGEEVFRVTASPVCRSFTKQSQYSFTEDVLSLSKSLLQRERALLLVRIECFILAGTEGEMDWSRERRVRARGEINAPAAAQKQREKSSVFLAFRQPQVCRFGDLGNWQRSRTFDWCVCECVSHAGRSRCPNQKSMHSSLTDAPLLRRVIFGKKSCFVLLFSRQLSRTIKFFSPFQKKLFSLMSQTVLSADHSVRDVWPSSNFTRGLCCRHSAISAFRVGNCSGVWQQSLRAITPGCGGKKEKSKLC